MEQTDLHSCRTPARLAFADHMNRLVAGDRAPSAPKRAEMLTRVDPVLDWVERALSLPNMQFMPKTNFSSRLYLAAPSPARASCVICS